MSSSTQIASWKARESHQSTSQICVEIKTLGAHKSRWTSAFWNSVSFSTLDSACSSHRKQGSQKADGLLGGSFTHCLVPLSPSHADLSRCFISEIKGGKIKEESVWEWSVQTYSFCNLLHCQNCEAQRPSKLLGDLYWHPHHSNHNSLSHLRGGPSLVRHSKSEPFYSPSGSKWLTQFSSQHRSQELLKPMLASVSPQGSRNASLPESRSRPV